MTHRLHITSDDGYVGLIVPARTGIVYETQAGGICCQHPAIEGFFWPMNWRMWEDEQESALLDWAVGHYQSPKDVIAVDHALDKWDLEQIFRAPTPLEASEQLLPFSWRDGKQLAHIPEYGEAWVPVCVREAPDNGGFILNGDAPPSGFVGRCMILTYPNSD